MYIYIYIYAVLILLFIYWILCMYKDLSDLTCVIFFFKVHLEKWGNR